MRQESPPPRHSLSVHYKHRYFRNDERLLCHFTTSGLHCMFSGSRYRGVMRAATGFEGVSVARYGLEAGLILLLCEM